MMCFTAISFVYVLTAQVLELANGNSLQSVPLMAPVLALQFDSAQLFAATHSGELHSFKWYVTVDSAEMTGKGVLV